MSQQGDGAIPPAAAGVQGDSAQVLDARKVTRRFGGLVAVKTVDFRVGPKEIVGLIGPNGAGKTTFFNCITGLYSPDDGDITFEGQPLRGSVVARGRAGLGRTF